eukprot:Gb_13004 [translate_table: standard]
MCVVKAACFHLVGVVVMLLLNECTGARTRTVPARPWGGRSTYYGSQRVPDYYADNYNYNANSKSFNVVSFGAKGDGVTDDTKAFQAAWQAACNVESAVMEVPTGLRFLLLPTAFSGPCQSNIVFKLDGTIVAPVNPHAWGSGLLDWIQFTKLHDISIQGNGIIDGRGAAWWELSNYEESMGSGMPSTKPTALRFYGSHNVIVDSITIQNSPQCHLKFDTCTSVHVSNIIISSPQNSPNTDGIHLQNSQDVEIHHSSMGCGDDCVSIQTGCSNIRLHNINCGPGHGISIGGLGKGGTKACVSNVTFHDSIIQDALNGVRIKTWQGGLGSVKGISFSNLQVSNVRIPIVIDQFYCDNHVCKNQTSAVAISGVAYQEIRGTYLDRPIHLACSNSVPCTDVSLVDIELRPVQYASPQSFCWNTYGSSQTPTMPGCLEVGKPYKNPGRTQSNMDAC